MPVYSYDPPERFVAGTVGQPGERTFYLQATVGTRVTSVALEKGQVSQLAERLDELLDEVSRRTGAGSSIAGIELDDGPLDLPLTEDFRVGAIALAWDHEGERVIIEAQEESEEPLEPLADDIPEDGPAMLRVRITAEAARAFSRRAIKVVQAGTAALPAVRAATRPGRPRVPAAERSPGRAWLMRRRPAGRGGNGGPGVAGQRCHRTRLRCSHRTGARAPRPATACRCWRLGVLALLAMARPGSGPRTRAWLCSRAVSWKSRAGW